MPLDHHRLHVYRESLALLAALDAVADEPPLGSGRLKDQLDNAATSIVANIAEGAAEFESKREEALLSNGSTLSDRSRGFDRHARAKTAHQSRGSRPA